MNYLKKIAIGSGIIISLGIYYKLTGVVDKKVQLIELRDSSRKLAHNTRI